MASITNLTINDGQATPVAQTFVVTSRYPTVQWELRTGNFANLYPRIVVATSRNPKSGIFRAKGAISVPNGNPTTGELISTSRCNFEYVHSDRSTAAQRADLRAFTFGLMTNGSLAPVVRDMETLA